MGNVAGPRICFGAKELASVCKPDILPPGGLSALLDKAGSAAIFAFRMSYSNWIAQSAVIYQPARQEAPRGCSVRASGDRGSEFPCPTGGTAPIPFVTIHPTRDTTLSPAPPRALSPGRPEAARSRSTATYRETAGSVPSRCVNGGSRLPRHGAAQVAAASVPLRLEGVAGYRLPAGRGPFGLAGCAWPAVLISALSATDKKRLPSRGLLLHRRHWRQRCTGTCNRRPRTLPEFRAVASPTDGHLTALQSLFVRLGKDDHVELA
jgi:hypothetical protein